MIMKASARESSRRRSGFTVVFVVVVVALVLAGGVFGGEVDTSVQKKRGRAAEEWTGEASKGVKEIEVEAQAQGEYEYVYVDADGEYHEQGDGDGEEEDDDEEEDDVEEEEDEDEFARQRPPPRQVKSGYVVSPPLKSPTPPRPYSRVNTLREIKDITECLSRNHSYTEKLRDDHQLNLKQEKELKKENRRVKRELKAQELAEIAEEKDGKRHQMSKMNSKELFEQEAHNERIEKANVQKQAEEEELAKPKEKTMAVGDKVMARYQRKNKYLFGKISAVRKDGMYNIKYDNGKEEYGVDKSLIIKPESEREIARGTKIGVNEEQKAHTLSMKDQQKRELQEMKERQEQLLADELAAQEERDRDPGRRMGADCESQACGACKLVVGEFAQRIHSNINNKAVQTLSELFDYITPFCSSAQIKGKYNDVVEVVCKKMFTMRDHREFFIREFEADTDWVNVLNPDTLRSKKQKICEMSGFCADDSFEYERDDGDGWGSDECFVCHAFMGDLEEKVSLYRRVDDRVSLDIANAACDNLVLSPRLSKVCKTFTGSSEVAFDVAWITKLHFEAIAKGLFTHRNFPDMACENLSKCQRWVDTESDEREKVMNEIDPVFS